MAFRNPNNTPYTVVTNALINDRSISFECRGMLIYLLSKPQDWQGQNYDIEYAGDIGHRTRRRIVREAEDAGYLEYRREHTEGRLNCYYAVHATPLPPDQRTDASTMRAGKIQTPQSGRSVQTYHSEGSQDEGSQSEGAIESKDPPSKVFTNQVAAPAPAGISDEERKTSEIATRARVDRDHAAALVALLSPPLDLVTAVLDAWEASCARQNSRARENPIGWIRAALRDPVRFLIVQKPEGWVYPGRKRRRATAQPPLFPDPATTRREAQERESQAKAARGYWAGLHLEVRVSRVEALMEGSQFHRERLARWRTEDPDLKELPSTFITLLTEEMLHAG